MSFSSHEIFTINEIRKIIVHLSCDLLKTLNTSQYLQSKSLDYPFTIKNLSTGFLFRSVQETDITTLANVIMTNGIIYYDHYKKHGGGFETFYQETFEEALEITSRDL